MLSVAIVKVAAKDLMYEQLNRVLLIWWKL